MPTFMAFKDGQKIHELVGANPSGLQVCGRTTLLVSIYTDIAPT